MRSLPRALRESNPLTSKDTEFSKILWREIISEGDKKNEHYQDLISDYHVHSFSKSLEDQFPDVDFEKIKQLHNLRKGMVSRLGMKREAGIILAAATIVLKSIPQSVVSRVIKYETFELIIFILTCAVIVYLSLIFLPLFAKFREARRVHGFAGYVLVYICIRNRNEERGQSSM